MRSISKKLEGIAKVIHLAKDENQLVLLLEELLTSAEIDKIHERIKVITCLKEGLSQRETSQKCGAAIATVSRGARLFQKQSLVIESIIDQARAMGWWQKLFWRT